MSFLSRRKSFPPGTADRARGKRPSSWRLTATVHIRERQAERRMPLVRVSKRHGSRSGGALSLVDGGLLHRRQHLQDGVDAGDVQKPLHLGRR